MKIVIDADRSIRDLETELDTPTLTELQHAVGGLIELICLKDGNIMVINEEGKLMGDLGVNLIASSIAFPNSEDVVLGAAVILSKNLIH